MSVGVEVSPGWLIGALVLASVAVLVVVIAAVAGSGVCLGTRVRVGQGVGVNGDVGVGRSVGIGGTPVMFCCAAGVSASLTCGWRVRALNINRKTIAANANSAIVN